MLCIKLHITCYISDNREHVVYQITDNMLYIRLQRTCYISDYREHVIYQIIENMFRIREHVPYQYIREHVPYQYIRLQKLQLIMSSTIKYTIKIIHPLSK